MAKGKVVKKVLDTAEKVVLGDADKSVKSVEDAVKKAGGK